MKKITVIGIIVTVLTVIVIGRRLQKEVKPHQYHIAIVQTASHPALDAVREGFIDELQKRMSDSVTTRTYNVQGSITQAHMLAQQLQSDEHINVIFAIATPAVQAMAAVEKDKPIIIAAVTDPAALGILHPLTNVTGTNDMIDITAALDLMQQLIANVQHVGLLFTAGETNAVVAAAQMRADLERRGIQVTDYTVNSDVDMPAVVDRACRTVDVIVAPTDNTVAASIHLIVDIAQRYNKPVIVSDIMLVEAGALAARGVNYYDAGRQSAALAQQVLDGVKPYELPIQQPPCDTIVINKHVLAQLGLHVPASLRAHVTFVE